MVATLAPEERITLQSYTTLATTRNKSHSNFDYWGQEFEIFSRLMSVGKILDIGCGAGRDSLLFNRPQYDYLGIDLCFEMLEQAQALSPHKQFKLMDINNLCFPPASFDGFWAAASLIHIPDAKIRSVLAGIRRIMKPSSYGFISMKEGEGSSMVKGRVAGTDRFFVFYHQQRFSSLLRECGFEAEITGKNLKEFNPPNSPTVWLTFFVRAV